MARRRRTRRMPPRCGSSPRQADARLTARVNSATTPSSAIGRARGRPADTPRSRTRSATSSGGRANHLPSPLRRERGVARGAARTTARLGLGEGIVTTSAQAALLRRTAPGAGPCEALAGWPVRSATAPGLTPARRPAPRLARPAHASRTRRPRAALSDAPRSGPRRSAATPAELSASPAARPLKLRGGFGLKDSPARRCGAGDRYVFRCATTKAAVASPSGAPARNRSPASSTSSRSEGSSQPSPSARWHPMPKAGAIAAAAPAAPSRRARRSDATPRRRALRCDAQLLGPRARLVGGQDQRRARLARTGGGEGLRDGGAAALVGEQLRAGTLRRGRAPLVRRHQQQRSVVRRAHGDQHVLEHRQHQRGALRRPQHRGQARLRLAEALDRHDHAEVARRGAHDVAASTTRRASASRRSALVIIVSQTTARSPSAPTAPARAASTASRTNTSSSPA